MPIAFQTCIVSCFHQNRCVENRKISVIIPVFNSLQHLPTCLDSVASARHRYGNTELIVLDNGSTDGTYEWLLAHYKDSARIYQLKDVTIASLRNFGAKVAEGDYLGFVDSDCVISADYFVRAIEIMASVGTDAAGCNVYALPARPHWIEKTWDQINRLPIDTFVPYLLTGSLVIKRTAFEMVGGFSEGLVTGEDTEFGLRLNAAGSKLFASSGVRAVHLGNPKTIPEFFRKQIWHGLGMFGTFRVTSLDKPVVMTLVHLFLSVAGAVGLLFGPWGLAGRIGGLVVLSALAPSATIVYRSKTQGKLINPAGCFLLYHLYYDARCLALFKLVYRRCLGSIR